MISAMRCSSSGMLSPLPRRKPANANRCSPFTSPGFAGSNFFKAPDKELAVACVSAWNDWAMDEWAAGMPGRQIPLAIVPYWDIDATGAMTGISGITNDAAYTQTGSSANTFTGATSETVVNAAGGSANALTLSGTLGIFDGSDTFRGLYLNYTNSDHTGSSNIFYGLDIAGGAEYHCRLVAEHMAREGR